MIELLLAAERMLAVGLLDNAERLFRQVADADPRNAIAVVGLARVTLERGDEQGAIDEARRALEIDPENVAAQRMIERLEEVIATRTGALVPAVPPPEPEPSATLVADPAPEGVVSLGAAGFEPAFKRRRVPIDRPSLLGFMRARITAFLRRR